MSFTAGVASKPSAKSASAASSKESSKLKHSENEAARRKRLADKFLALEAMVNDENNHQADGSVSGGEQEGSRAPPAEASRIHILQSAIDALKIQRNTIEKLEAKLAVAAAAAANSASNSMGDAPNSNMASSTTPSQQNATMKSESYAMQTASYAAGQSAPYATGQSASYAGGQTTSASAAAAANHGAAPMILSINPSSPAHATSPTATELLRSNVFFAAQAAAAAAAAGQNHHINGGSGGGRGNGPVNAVAHPQSQHTEQDYQLLAALAQQQQMQIQQMQMAAQSQALSPPSGSGSGTGSGVKRSSSSARLAELHHLQQSDAPMTLHASSLDRQTSGHSIDYHSSASASSSAASGTRSRAASATGSQPPHLSMIGVGTGSMMAAGAGMMGSNVGGGGGGAAVTPASLAASLEMHKRRRTFDEDQNLAAFAAASAAAAASSAAAATAASSGTAPGTPRTGAGSISRSPAQGGRTVLSSSGAASVHFVPLANLPLLAAQPCFLCTLDGVVLDCTHSFLSLLGYPVSGDPSHDKAAVVSQSLFSLVHPADVKNCLATVKNCLWTGAQAQANAPGSVCAANILSGIEDVVKNFLRPLGAPAPLGSRRSSGASTAGSPMVLSSAGSSTPLRMVLFAVANRSAGPAAPLNMLFGIVAPLADPSLGPAGLAGITPHGFPHGSKACQAEIARECHDMLDVDQQGYLVAVMYGVPAQKLGGSGSGTPRSGMVGMHTGMGGASGSGGGSSGGVLGPSASPIHASLPSPGHATSLYRPLHPHSSLPAAHQHTGSGLMPPQSSSLFSQALSLGSVHGGSHSRSPSSGGGGGASGGVSMHGSMSHQNLQSMAGGHTNPLSPSSSSSSSKSAAALHAEQHHLAMQQPHSAGVGGFRGHTSSPMMHLQHAHHEPEHGSLAVPLMQRSRTVQPAHGTPGQQHHTLQQPHQYSPQPIQQPNSPLHADPQLPALPHAQSTPVPHTPHHGTGHISQLGSPLDPQHLFRSPLTHGGGASGDDPALAPSVGTPFTPGPLGNFSADTPSGGGVSGGVPAMFGSPTFAPATTNSLPPASPALFQSYSGIGGNSGVGAGLGGNSHVYPSPLSPFTMVRHGSSIDSNVDDGAGGTQSSGEDGSSGGGSGGVGGVGGVDLMDSGASVADLDDMHSLAAPHHQHPHPSQNSLHDPDEDDVGLVRAAVPAGLGSTPPEGDDSVMEADAATFD